MLLEKLIISPIESIFGIINLPGDKSITHRALMLSAISNQRARLHNWLPSLDCLATCDALRALGVEINITDEKTLQINGLGLYGLQPANRIIDVGNSGTTMRLLSGILAAQKFDSIITGDNSIRKRPMRRIIDPLSRMGAKIAATTDNFAPLYITGGQSLQSINYRMTVASAQVKSAILLADLYAQNKSTVIETVPSRDHTEIMLEFFMHNTNHAEIDLYIPSDISAAAFFIVAACIVKSSDLVIKNVGINPTRSGIIQVLRMMGAAITLSNIQRRNGELSADIRVRASKLYAIDIPLDLIPNIIDELPILAVAAACANGTTTVRGAQELRYKESDRITSIVEGLQNLGVTTQEFADGFSVTGGVFSGGTVNSYGDHRIAMAFAIAGLVAQQPVIVQDTCNIATSFPDFVKIAQQAGLNISIMCNSSAEAERGR